jgi:guanylate kinase
MPEAQLPELGFRGLVLFGAPAAGKSAMTHALCDLDSRFVLFRKLRTHDPEAVRRQEYREVTPEHLGHLSQSGALVSQVDRYGRSYAVDTAELERLIGLGHVPIVHTACLDELQALTNLPGWYGVVLWADVDVTRERLKERGDTNVEERLALHDDVHELARQGRLKSWPLVETATVRTEHEAAHMLLSVLTGMVTPAPAR